MTDHELGLALRARVQADHDLGLPPDGRRWQGLVADLCGQHQQELIPVLRYLVLSPQFLGAAGQEPPFQDTRMLERMGEELGQVFTAPLCRRMEAVLRGLAGQSAQAAQAAQAQLPPMAAPRGAEAGPELRAPEPRAPELRAPEPIAPREQRPVAPSSSPLLALLGFLSGGLLVALVGVLYWLTHNQPLPEPSANLPRSREAELPLQPSEPPSAPQDPLAPAVPGPTPEPVSPDPLDPAPEPEQKSEEKQQEQDLAGSDAAVASVQGLYGALSNKDFETARSLFAPGSASQFDEGFFSQFSRVSVSDLRETSRTGSTVNLEGVVTFVYPDGSVQRESRSYSVDTSSQPALITGSEFGRVIRGRQ
ncbi:MAG: hypothetical protein ACK5FE_02900 [Cyanobacteriota bacterium]|jgi:hypothetical protein